MSEDIKNIIKNGITQYLESKRNNNINYHVLQEIFPLERRVRSIIGGLETSFGTKVWEPLAKNLARKNGFEIYNEKKFKKPKEVPKEIETLINEWASKRENDLKQELSLDKYIEELRKIVKNLKIDYTNIEYKNLTSGQGIDLWMEKDGIEYITDIKTTQLNAGDGKKFNRHILKWYAYRIFQDPNVQIKAFISIPFNPYKSSWKKGDAGRSKPLIFGEDIITDKDFWTIISGCDETYNCIIKSFKELREENLSEIYRDIIYGDTENEEYIDTTKIRANRKYTVVELFGGAGGLALGLEEAGFENLGLVELDKNACDTLKVNRPNWNVIEGDIAEIAEKGIRNYIDKDAEVDLLSGGYPCQSFSHVCKKDGLEDVRGTMFYYYAKILKELMPKVFLAENVKGLVSHDEGKTLKTMIEVFTDIGYDVKYEVLKAIDYGVAQKRERIIIIGTRKDLTDVKYKFPKAFGYIPTLRDALKDVPKSEGSKYTEKYEERLNSIPPGGYFEALSIEDFLSKGIKKCPNKRRRTIRRLTWDEPGPALTSNSILRHINSCHPDETRPLTTREYARIQSFPDKWKFEGSVGQIYKQIANAFPVKLGKVIGLSIVDYLNRVEED
ncbi:TdeIII family type II restriction endonuclease [Paraclostridium bifermentans]|uniref:TdeIII family type II restriction endonuclease n=1 Tax=Paraclostridium bifermentans TaxID=1490 RepID=UPI00374FB23E